MCHRNRNYWGVLSARLYRSSSILVLGRIITLFLSAVSLEREVVKYKTMDAMTGPYFTDDHKLLCLYSYLFRTILSFPRCKIDVKQAKALISIRLIYHVPYITVVRLLSLYLTGSYFKSPLKLLIKGNKLTTTLKIPLQAPCVIYYPQQVQLIST